MPKPEDQAICKNIFKDGKTTTSKDNYTQTWIRLIRQLERTHSCTHQNCIEQDVFQFSGRDQANG